MQTSTFYKILNEELIQIIDKNPTDEELNKHKNIGQNKGYAFLIWFLDFYGQNKSYKNYITDGKDDFSCDIIFAKSDIERNEIYYAVQSKWINSNKGKEIDKKEFNSSLAEFSSIIDGSRKKGKNEKFNNKYDKLVSHLENNGKAKFIFFTAAQYNNEVDDTIQSFNKEHGPNIELIVIDIEKIKRDYIEFRFKEIITNNPLEYNYHAEDENIKIEIERYKNGVLGKEYVSSRDILQFEGRMQAYIFSLKPKTIHQLFKKYKFNLFFKNVRNPLHRSNYNEKIVETLQRRPDTFWYFNNGVTAITKRIPDIGKNANTITIKGLQVINGAQTIYSVYKAYENASYDEREVMDIDARISFRLIRSSDEDFNLEITRYTNSQNAMQPNDFAANLEEQQRLQLESFKTNFWYEKRRDEFRDKNKLKQYNIKVISNTDFARAYLAFKLLRPIEAINNEDKIFLKRTEDANGLYEVIFNKETRFEDMLSSYLIYTFISVNAEPSKTIEDGLLSLSQYAWNISLVTLPFFKIILDKYIILKGNNKNTNTLIQQTFLDSKGDFELIAQVYRYTESFIFSKIGDIDELKEVQNLTKLLSDERFFNKLKHDIEEKEITIEDIDMVDFTDVVMAQWKVN